MDVVVDGASMIVASSKIDTAVRDLAVTCQRIEPCLRELQSGGALSSELIDDKYGGKLADETRRIARSIESLQRTMSGLCKTYIDQVDQIDRFLY